MLSNIPQLLKSYVVLDTKRHLLFEKQFVRIFIYIREHPWIFLPRVGYGACKVKGIFQHWQAESGYTPMRPGIAKDGEEQQRHEAYPESPRLQHIPPAEQEIGYRGGDA